VHRTGTDAPWWAKATLSTLAAGCAGAAGGALLGTVGSAVDIPARAGIGTAIGISLVILPLLRVPVPQRDHETPQFLLHHGPLVWSLANGMLLGSAVTNRIGFWLWFLVPAGCLLSGSPLLGAALWGTYALARLLVIDAVAARMRQPACSVQSLTDRLVLSRWRILPVMTGLSVTAGVLVAVLLGT
jgi:hypothetical protein